MWEFYDIQEDTLEVNNLINSKNHAILIKTLKEELYKLKQKYGNHLTLNELRKITDIDFGGLESKKMN